MTTPVTTLDQILQEYKLNNNALVEAYLATGKQISHKTIQKARTGSRPISRKLQFQVTEALNAAAQPEKPWKREDVFGPDPVMLT